MKRKLIYILATVFLAAACSEPGVESPDEGKSGSKGKMDLEFKVEMPDQKAGLEDTNARASDTEVLTFDLLVFDENSKLLERIKIDQAAISGAGSMKTFTARLDASDYRRTIHLVANGRTTGGADRVNFSGATTGALESAVIPNLKTPTLNNTLVSSQIEPLIMWGRIALANVNSSTVVNNVKLLRSVAAVKVQKSAGVTNFNITKFTVYQTAKEGKVAPSAYTSAASVPVNATPAGTGYINYNSWTTNGSWATPDQTIYVYERNNNSETDCIWVMVEGSFNHNGTWKTGYYKLILGDSQMLDVVRNHRYTLTINRVDGAGYDTLAEAEAGAPSNSMISTEIVDEDVEITSIVANGNYRLGLSNNDFTLYGAAANSIPVAVCYSDYTNVTVAITNGSTWCPAAGLSVTNDGGGKHTIKANFVGTPSTTYAATITVTSGDLRQDINVYWKPLNSASGYQADGDSYVINLTETSKLGWEARVVDASVYTGLRLHPTNSSPASFPDATGTAGFVTTQKNKAFLHIKKDATANGAVMISPSGGAKNHRIGIQN